ncbi:MAG: hypothetical protein HYZ54_12910 [Ignavibacteriae bacterium]|nr:hypothetical protein [Ignavibacteriota bacterium]
MTTQKILELCTRQIAENSIIDLPENIFSALTVEQANAIVDHFRGKAFLRLPLKERTFFDWLKIYDEHVWRDLWGDDSVEPPYIVSVIFLPMLLDDVRGFPICDLETTDNYYFTNDHFISDEADVLIEASKERFLDQKTLTVSQLLALEISLSPIDIWRFAYHHKIDLTQAKGAVKRLTDEKMLIHLKTSEDLADFIEFG